MNSSKTAPTGTCTAAIGNHEEFSEFEGLRYLAYHDTALNKWTLNATTDVDSHGLYQVITLMLPKEGDVVNKTYDITQNPGNATQANAWWIRVLGPDYTYHRATSGSITVTLDETKKTLEGEFEFEGTRVTVSEGALQLKEFGDSKQTRATGSVMCALTGEVNASYEARLVHYSQPPGNHTFPPSRECWSEHTASKPEPFIRRIVIETARNLPLGTYKVTPGSQEVRVMFFDYSGHGFYHGVSGTVTVNSVPSAVPVAGEVFAGTFSFKAQTTINDIVYSVDLESGTFHIVI